MPSPKSANGLTALPDFKQAAWDGIFPAMQAGEYDMLADGVTFTEERDKDVDFSMPYVYSQPVPGGTRGRNPHGRTNEGRSQCKDWNPDWHDQ